MKQILLMIAVVALVGCGKKEPELRSEKVITPESASCASGCWSITRFRFDGRGNNHLNRLINVDMVLAVLGS
jgi:hypothetical protein